MSRYRKPDQLIEELYAENTKLKWINNHQIFQIEKLREALDKVGGFALGLPSSQVKGNILHIINEALEQSDE